MQIVEVKNNLVKVSFDAVSDGLFLSGFVVIKDAAQAFIGQVINLDANASGSFAVVKLLFVFNDEGVITGYNGSIPDLNSLLDVVHPTELLEILPVQNPIVIGDLAQQNTLLKLDRSLLEENLLICSEKVENNLSLMELFAVQLYNEGKKLLVIDTVGNVNFSPNKVYAGKDFKLPLNYESLNFIYEKGLEDASPETKAMIQEVFLEVQNYVKTLPEKFIPFQDFKAVVDSQYEETELVELVLLKNKLLKYNEEGVFAQEQNEFNSLRASFNFVEPTIFDVSGVDEKIQREMISYAYSLANNIDGTYVFCNIDNENSDKKLLKQIFMSNKVYSTLICGYSYKYLKEIKQLAKNLILFAPIHQQNDFAGYNTFLNKLNNHEFIIYGKTTQYFPLIVKLEAASQAVGEGEEERVNIDEESDFAGAQTPTYEEIQEENLSAPEPFSPSSENDLDEQINQDVDSLYMPPKQEDFSVEVIEDDHGETSITEEDLDMLDDVGDIEELSTQEETVSWDEVNEETEEYQYEEEVEEDNFSTEEDNLSASQPLSSSADEEVEILPVKSANTPIVPVYSADIEPKAESDELDQGDVVSHPKYGKGTVEKLITYGAKTLCSINFDNVGRRLLDPTLVELKKVEI